MKFTLTISDMTSEDVYNVLSSVEGEVQGQTPEIHADAGILANAELQEITDEEVDADGLPWDERIHSGNRKKTAKGVWQRRRGVKDVTYDEVVEELRGGKAEENLPEAPTPVQAELPVAPVTPTPVPQSAAPTPTPVVNGSARDFKGFMSQATALFAQNQIDQNYLPEIVQRINNDFKTEINTITDIANNNEMVEYAWQCLQVDGKITA